ncbi:MAG TPA: 50S ribosomal protein L24 [Gemmatimonadales bacterium]|nr:50S ribosomal protein L24 [Gemmatimonadales bacterium]
MHIAKGDMVQVISGEEKGKRGRVKRVLPRSGRLEVEGINIVTKHQKPTGSAPGEIIRREGAIHHSKVMLIDPKTGEPTRIRRQKDADGTLERIAVRSGQSIPRNR